MYIVQCTYRPYTLRTSKKGQPLYNGENSRIYISPICHFISEVPLYIHLHSDCLSFFLFSKKSLLGSSVCVCVGGGVGMISVVL